MPECTCRIEWGWCGAAFILCPMHRAAPDLLAALHGGPGAQPGAMASNLQWWAKLIEEGGLTPSLANIAIDTLRKYAATIRAAIERAEGKAP